MRVSFLEFPLPLLKPPIAWPACDCLIASLDDLVAMKLLAVAQRGTKKDFLDVYALGGRGSRSAGCWSFTVESSRSRTSVACCRPSAISMMPIRNRCRLMVTEISWERVKKTIRSWVKATVNAAGPSESPTG